MFKSARWRSEKNKVKAVFKLQFHATQLTQLGGDALMISVIPADVGKPTARLDKAKVTDGSCCWEKPHYETMKFTQDPKTGKFHEKVYHFVVAMGSSKFGGVGEVLVDFSSYAEATKLSSLSLPLKSVNSAGVLHVSIQRVQGSFDQRDVDGIENANNQDRSLRAQFSIGDVDGSVGSNPTEDHGTLRDNINKVCRISSGSDITMSSSDSSFGLDTESEPKKTKTTHESSTTTSYEEQRQRSPRWDWLNGSTPEIITDDSSLSTRDETLLGEISEESSPDTVIKKLKAELAVLTRQANVSELELQTLRKQIVKESKRGQDLSNEVVMLKEERNAFKEECEKLKAYQKHTEVKVKLNNMLLIEEGDPWALVGELRQELNYEKDLNLNLRLQLQKMQESNAELILAVRDLDEMLEQKDERSKSKSKSKCSSSKSETDDDVDDDEEQKALEEIVREHSGVKETYLLEQKIVDLYGEMELYKRDKDELEMQMEQIALDYEILKQENHDMACKLEQSQLQEQLKMQYECTMSYATVNELEVRIESLENEVKSKSEELSKSNLAIKELETHVKNLEEDLENQARGFEADLEDLTRAKVELERRAIRAEENLRKTKLQNANTAERLQEEFRRLSTQMASTFEANEKVATKAMDECSQLRVEKRILEETLEKVKQDLRYLGDCYEEKFVDFSEQINLKSKQLDKMEKQIEHLKITSRTEILRLKEEMQNLEREKKELEKEFDFAKMELESSKKELTQLRGADKDKDSEVERLRSKMERLKTRCHDMKVTLIDNESENERLKKEFSELRSDLKKREDVISSMEKKVKDSNNRVTVLEGSKTTSRNTKPVPVSPRSSKELTDLRDRIKLLEDQVKLKETALDSSENLFLEKEKDLQKKIELERRLEDLVRNAENSQERTAENPIPMTSSPNARSPNFDELSNEMVVLKTKNKSMEVELKEMQERYSEISLKFAEVEGERQQLVMSLRNIKNAKKC